MLDVPDEGHTGSPWVGVSRRDDPDRGRDRRRADPMRSASAMPGTDFETYSAQPRRGSFRRDEHPRGILGVSDLSLRERGPSPAYTPNPERTTSQISAGQGVRPSPLGTTSSTTVNSNALSPIASASASRAPSDRTDSTETQRRSTRPSAPDLPRGLSSGPLREGATWSARPDNLDGSPVVPAVEELDPLETPTRPTANGINQPSANSVVRFDTNPVTAEVADPPPSEATRLTESEKDPNVYSHTEEEKVPETNEHTEAVTENRQESQVTDSPERMPERDPLPSESTQTQQPPNRAASIRTIASHISTSTTNSISSNEHSAEIHHPAMAAVEPISSMTTPADTPLQTPTASAPPSIRNRFSSEGIPLSRAGSSGSQRPPLETSDSAPTPPASTPPSGSSRRSSLLARDSRAAFSQNSSANNSITELTETRQGRQSRLGSTSTIVERIPAPGSNTSPRSSSSHLALGHLLDTSPRSNRTTRGSFTLAMKPNMDHLKEGSRDGESDGRGRKTGKFSLSAAFRGLSQDVKDRVNHKRPSSRSRGPVEGDASGRARAPSVAEGSQSHLQTISARSTSRQASGSGLPASLLSESSVARTGRAESFSSAAEEFHPPFGRGGAGSRSRERRADSPAGDRSASRGRGRNKGMKALTGALGIGPGGTLEDEMGEDMHNWKEFRKGEQPLIFGELELITS